MGYQLPIDNSWKIIQDAIKHAGENLNVELRHVYSTPGNQGFYIEISDFTVAKKLNDTTDDYYKDDHTFNLNIPYTYFNEDAILPLDKDLGLKSYDDVEVKAELRCMNLIQETWKKWIPDHKVFTTKDLQNIINEALDKLWQNKKISIHVKGNGNEFAEKYIHIHFTWASLESWLISRGSPSKALFFDVTFTLNDYYDDVGKNAVDGLVGESILRGKNRHDICLLRVAYLIYAEAIGFVKNNYPGFYAKYKRGEL